MIATLGRFTRQRALELIAAVAAAGFLFSGRIGWRAAWLEIDVDLLLLLFALLVTVEILRNSGYVDGLVAALVTRFRHTRSFDAMLIATAGFLATLLTNDVALFVVIPFTVIAGRLSDMDTENAIVLQIIATNLIGCLTPLGNPQNLFIYHQSGWSAARFIGVMIPFVVWCAAGIFLALLLSGGSRPIRVVTAELPTRKRPVAIAGAICFVLVLLEIARLLPAWVPAIAAAVAGVSILRRRLLDVDLSIIPLFFFAFIVVAGLRTLDLTAMLRLDSYWLAIALSQVISNVPATVLLTPFADGNWRDLLYGVNAGGCGTIIASLANLLGWRIYVRESNRDPKFFRRLTLFNVAFLAWAALGGWMLLRM